MSQFQTLKSDLTQSRIVDSNSVSIHEDEIAVRIESYAFTANNVTYGVAGDTIGYWKFFPAKNNADNEFNAMQSGGRIIGLDDEHIVLSTGEFRNRYLAQNIKSVNGKLIKININNFDFKIISIGHRNPQGLLLDKDENFILSHKKGYFID